MLSTARNRALFCAAIVLVCFGVGAEEMQGALSCESTDGEASELVHAQSGVRRIQPHVLEIRTKKGVRRFSDQPPHTDGEMGGVHWRYCGFNSDMKAHLIGRTDAGIHSGELLMIESGKRIPAGHTVLVSPRGKMYLAIEQNAGEDGENWSIHDRAGKTLWKGYAGTITTVDGVETVTATFDRPAWVANDRLTARSICAGSKIEGTVSLTVSLRGTSAWQGQVKCEPND